MFKPLFLLTIMTLLCTRCSVAPFLESPHITSGIKVEAAITTSEQSLHWELSDTITRSGVNSRSIDHDFSGEVVNGLPRFSLGIQNKVELGGYLIGSFSSLAWEGRIKYCMLDYGSAVFFKNIGAAALCGTKGFNAEWDNARRSWGVLTIGTLHRHSKLELEYIVMPSLGYNNVGSNDD